MESLNLTLTTGQQLFLMLALIWNLTWKGVALWAAARNNSKPWFVVLLVVNTLGLLEILYIFIFSKPNTDNKEH